jgi:plastocyanin
MPLYRYAEDAKPGQTQGENVKELWHVVTVGMPQGAAEPASSAGSKTWTVLVGGEGGIEKQEYGPAGAWQFMRFYPESITINAGDTIVWKLNSVEPHTVTFPKSGEKSPELVVAEEGKTQRMMFNPLAISPQGKETYDGTVLTGSGQMGGEPQFPKEYKLTFTKPGTYAYFCAFHPMMKGTIIVQAAGKPSPKTQAQLDAEAKAQLEADTQAAMKVKPEAEKLVTRSGPNGSTVHEVKIGYGDGILTWMRFNPTKLTIKAGDTVEWTQADTDTPHTVTFTSGQEEPELVLVENQTAGPPKLILNPEALAPAGKGTYSGKGYFNSGFIWGTKEPTSGPRTYSLTFDTPGTYKYTCILHDMMGMQGEITVQPKSK